MAEIVGIVASLVGPAIELGKFIFAPIKRQFNYLCCLNNNIHNLRDEAEKLEDARATLQMQVVAAENNAEVIFPEVERWLHSSNEIKVSISGIETEIPKVQTGFLNLKSRFSLSRNAKKTTKVMKELRDGSKFSHISQPAPPPAMESIPFEQTYEFETRNQIEEDIMEALRGEKVNVLGICGMGGVGKTTMAKRIMNRVREEKLFDEIFMVVVSQPVDMFKIQHEISELLGLKLEVESLPARAHKLRVRLSKKRILVVLDDVWEILEMVNLGIPCESGVKGCTVLLTSRDRDVLNAMNVQNVCALQILPEEEAWFLFKERVGTCVNEMHLISVAKEVAKECKGLPIALVTVGKALKDKKGKSIWKDALQQLKSSNPIDIPHVLAEVYSPLKLSYDFLDNQHARSVFLLCSLFPEDSNISLKYLTWYIMGLDIFKGIRNLEEAKNRVCSLVELLKSRFLLQDGYNERHVKMHDIARDVAIFIASREGLVDTNFNSIDWSRKQYYSDCTWISMFPKESIELPMVLDVPSLRLLMIHNSEKREIQIYDQFFEGMKELNVLSFTSHSFRSLPQTIKLLKNLRTLYLHSCTLYNISVVGELLSLEILKCHSCHEMFQLPIEIGKLNRLRSLDFSNCRSLKSVAPGVISSLVRLEELKMISSFKRWEAEKNGKKRWNASLNELQSLSNLTCLKIEIEDHTLAAEEIRLSSKIVKYDIRFFDNHFRKHVKKSVYLKLSREIGLGDWIQNFVRSSEHLNLRGDGSNKFDFTQFQDINCLRFGFCSTMKKLVSTTSIDWRFDVFSVLEYLELCNLPNLEEICDGPIQAGSDSFKNLKELVIFDLPALRYLWNSRNQNVSLSNLSCIHIQGCAKLRNLFLLTMAKGVLLQLKKLGVGGCAMIEEVFLNENENDGEGHITFPKLEKLSLHYLPSLTTFFKGIESIQFPLLTEMEIDSCPELTSFISSTGNNISFAGHDYDSCHLFCNQKVTFGSLKELRIYKYENTSNLWCHQIPPDFFSQLKILGIYYSGSLRSLFSSSIPGNPVNVKEPITRDCFEMVNVVADKENVCEKYSPFFPKLKELTLHFLDTLENFCGLRCALELPSLMEVSICKCPKMESFTMGSLSTPTLKRLSIDSKEKDVEDLNGAVQLCFREKESAQCDEEEEEKEEESDEENNESYEDREESDEEVQEESDEEKKEEWEHEKDEIEGDEV